MTDRPSNPDPQTPTLPEEAPLDPQPTASSGAERPPLPPDPAAYDSPRASAARARGLAAPYIAGGRDPEPDEGRREERFYGRILVAMILVIVLGGFVIGILSVLLHLGA